MSATVAIQGKGKKVGTPNYKNEVLLNLIEFYLPAGNEQWEIVAQRYQEVSKEASFQRQTMQEESETDWDQQQVGTASTCCSSSRNSKKDSN